MRKILAAILLLVASVAVRAERLGFETIILEWPDGYYSQAGENQIQMAGPNGEHVTILQFSLDDTASDVEAKAKTDTLRTYAESEMPKAAADEGAIVIRELKRTDFDERHTLYTMASELTHEKQKRYLLEYFLVGVKGGAYFSIVGNGDSTPAIATFDPVFAAVQWRD